MATVSPAEQARRNRRARLTKYELLADANGDGILSMEESRQAKLLEQNWDRLGLADPMEMEEITSGVETVSAVAQASVEAEPTVTGVNPAAAAAPPSFAGIVLTKDFGTYAGQCRKYTAEEKATIKLHMEAKKKQEEKWAIKYQCAPSMKNKCAYV